MAKKRKRRRKQKDKQNKEKTNSKEKSRLNVDVASPDSNNDSQQMVSGSFGVVKKDRHPEEQTGLSGSIVGLASGEISLNPNDPLKVNFDAPDKSILVESEAAVEESPFYYQDGKDLSPSSKKSTLRLKLNQEEDENELFKTPVPGRKRKSKSVSQVEEERVPSKNNSKVDKAKFVPGAHNFPFVDLKKQPEYENQEIPTNKEEISEVVSNKISNKSETEATEAVEAVEESSEVASEPEATEATEVTEAVEESSGVVSEPEVTEAVEESSGVVSEPEVTEAVEESSGVV
nr:hypothetical protein [Deltaproteobacteria bacterium]